MAYEIAGIAECLLCGRKFSGPMGLEIQAVGARAQQVATYMLKLAEHLEEAHPNEVQAINTSALSYQGMLKLSNYRTTDASLAEQRDRLRWEVHQRTTAARISDKTIEDKCDQIAHAICSKLDSRGSIVRNEELLEDITDVIGPILRHVRDELEERGRYKDQTAALVTTH